MPRGTVRDGYLRETPCVDLSREDLDGTLPGHAVPRLDNRRAETLTVNTGSRHVLEKTGLTLVRTFHRDGLDAVEGSEHGVVEYALIRAD
jgi:hypothetical protein